MGMTWHQKLRISEGWGPWGPGIVGVPAPHTSMSSVPPGRGAEPRRHAWMAALPGQRLLLPKICSKICNQTWPEEGVGGGGEAGRDC